MTAKEYLQQMRKVDVIISQMFKEKEELQATLTNISSPNMSQERVQGGKLLGETGYSQKIIRLVDLETEIDSRISNYSDLRHKIICQIHDLPDIRYINVLHKHYIENKKLKAIAVEMNYTYQYIKELHKCALQEFSKTYQNLL